MHLWPNNDGDHGRSQLHVRVPQCISVELLMREAAIYNSIQLSTGALTWADITELVRYWQAAHIALKVDGKAGSQTLAALRETMRPALFLHCPMPVLSDGRKAVVTSEFRPADRPNHDGIDWFYKWHTGDKPDHVGDHGCAGRNADGTPKWCVPYGTMAIAAAPGRVSLAGTSPTGWRVWIDHGNGLRTGYFHLLGLRVAVGDEVTVGQSLGDVGDNPADHDGRHLHFELSPTDRYAPMDPVPWMVG